MSGPRVAWNGLTYIGELPRDPSLPRSVTRRQAKQALRLAGILDKVQPAISAIPDALERDLAQIWWDDSQEFVRTNATLNKLAKTSVEDGGLGLDDEGIDNLFALAESVDNVTETAPPAV